MRAIGLAIVLVLAPLADAATQEPVVEPRPRVRVNHDCVTVPGPRGPRIQCQTHTGIVAAVSADEILLADERGVQSAVSLMSVARLEVSVGRRSQVWKGAGIGLLAGAFTGVIVAAVTVDCSGGSESCSPFPSEESSVAVAGTVFGLGGSLVGGSVGAFLRTDRWKEVSFERLRMSVAPQGEGRSTLQPPPVEPGTRVRVKAPDCGVRGWTTTVVALRGDTLLLGWTDCPLASVTRFEVSQGQRSNAGKGALYGGVIGAIGGGIFGGTKQGNVKRENEILKGAAIFGGAGFAAGMILGTITSGERWDEASLDRLRVSVVPHRDGRFALAASIRF